MEHRVPELDTEERRGDTEKRRDGDLLSITPPVGAAFEPRTLNQIVAEKQNILAEQIARPKCLFEFTLLSDPVRSAGTRSPAFSNLSPARCQRHHQLAHHRWQPWDHVLP
jgi:hypothetical protein